MDTGSPSTATADTFRSFKNRLSYDYDKTTILATLLPDEILLHTGSLGKERRRFECVLLLGDVSGFTALTEKYTLTGRGGTYRMTKTLNAYIGKMVEVIMNHGGDILKFSGDAFLCCWKVISDGKMAHTVNKAVRCALFIQEKMGRYETDVKVSLRVKLAISAGTGTFAVIGTEETRHYVLDGDPIAEVRLAEHMCVSGDIVLAPSAWKFCEPEQYFYTIKGDQGHIKIISASRSSSKKVRSSSIIEPSARADWDTIVLNVTINQNGPYLRPFIIVPVLKQVDHQQPLEYLTEMRQVVTLFVNVLSFQASYDQHISLIDDAYCIICKFTDESSGCVNKVSLFDKDLMYVILFGLRGFQNEMEIKNALWCATNVHKSVSCMKGVEKVSIGVSTAKISHRSSGQDKSTSSESHSSLAFLSSAEESSTSPSTSGDLHTPTGLTYCGVVGHPLRREYTVIGSPVNKAARLMVAYPGKVTCERNTFLHSKLPATFFHLQEAKELKGLSEVGPIYEFLEEEEDKTREISGGPKYPILGREQAIHVFLSKLAALRGEQRKIAKTREEGTSKPLKIHHSGMAFHGGPRIGKTRLLEELCNESKSRGIPSQVVSLTSAHRRSPFATVAYLFQQLIGINELSTLKEKEDILISRFGKHLGSDELCYLNDILQVKFSITDSYATESSHDKMIKRRAVASKALTSYCSSIAPIYVIGVDDIHHIDPPSAILFSSFLSCDGVMLIVTVTGDLTASESPFRSSVGTEGIDFLSVGETEAALNYFYQHSLLLHYPLSGLPLEWMAALACQFLNVRGIPLDLETVLQNESQGNPGWVESYLLSLVQTGALLIITLSIKNSQFENLTFPNEKFVTLRKTEDLTGLKLNDLEVDDPKEFSDMEVKILKKEKSFSYWHQMKQTLDVNDAMMMASVANQRVCILAPNYKFDDASIPKTMYAVVMTAFDRLDPFAQLLVKIAAVLGNTCMRVMLVAVMDYPGSKKVAEAVRDIYDAQILCCGVPNPEKTFKTYMPSDILGYSGMDSYKPECYCDEGYRLNLGISLPKYAFCSLLKFRTTLYRDIAYGLLTDDQKKDFHGRAVKYLEGEAHKCSVCGGGPFFQVPSLSASLSEWLSAYESHNIVPDSDSSKEYGKLKSAYVERIVLRKHADMPPIEFNNVMDLPERDWSNRKSQDWIEEISIKSQNYFDVEDKLFKWFGFGHDTKKNLAVHRCDSDASMGVCLSRVDLRYCECHVTLSSVYIHLIEHARAAGLKKMLVALLIEFGAAAVPLGISTQAAKLLSEADHLLQELMKGGKKLDCYWFALGKIRVLRGQALLDLGQHQQALEILLSTLKSYGYPLPVNRFRISMVLLKESFNQWLYRHVPFLTSKGSHGSRAHSTVMAESLSLIFKISVEQNNWHLAELAAVKGLNEAVKTRKNFLALCKAYCDNMELSIQHFNLKQCSYLESLALKLCQQINGKITYGRSHLQVLARLYYATFKARSIRGELEAAVRIGFRIIGITNKMQQSASTKLKILPMLVHGLMLRRRLPETVEMLQELARTAEEESDTSGTTWYYALCLSLLLNTGFTLEKYITCKQYADERMDAMGTENVRDLNADRYLLISLWLWCVRCERWEEAQALENQSGFSVGISTVSAVIISLGLEEDAPSKNTLLTSYPNLFTALKYLEGLQLTLVGKLDTRGFSAIPDIYRRIIHVTSILKRISHYAPIVIPRLTHLRAHLSIIGAKTANAMWLLSDAASRSEKQGNLLEEAWIEHSKKVWLGLISGIVKDFWRDHCHEEPIDWHEDELVQWSAIMFSLPVPRNPL